MHQYLYITDRAANIQKGKVRKINVANGEVTTFVEHDVSVLDGALAVARFYSPYGITSDSTFDSNLGKRVQEIYVTDDQRHTIHRIRNVLLGDDFGDTGVVIGNIGNRSSFQVTIYKKTHDISCL